MNSLDVQSIFFNSLWIVGLAVLLATWSYAHYEAGIAKQKVREKFNELPYALMLDAGMLLLIAGLAATESRWWARGVWAVLGVSMGAEAMMRVWAHKHPHKESADDA